MNIYPDWKLTAPDFIVVIGGLLIIGFFVVYTVIAQQDIAEDDLTDAEFAKIYIEDGVLIRTSSHTLNQLLHHQDKYRDKRHIDIAEPNEPMFKDCTFAEPNDANIAYTDFDFTVEYTRITASVCLSNKNIEDERYDDMDDITAKWPENPVTIGGMTQDWSFTLFVEKGTKIFKEEVKE